jgi:hypothetical protein
MNREGAKTAKKEKRRKVFVCLMDLGLLSIATAPDF